MQKLTFHQSYGRQSGEKMMERRKFLILSGAATIMSAAASCAGTGEGREVRLRQSQVQADLIQSAFLYGYALFEFSRTARASVERGRPVNTLGHRTVLTDHTHRTVTAPNIDTLYSSAFLELSGGPMEVVTPEAPDRYHSITFMNAFTDNFATLGTRTNGGRRIRVWVAGPGWNGNIPEGVTLIRSDTNDVWMLGRTLIAGAADLEAARSVQSQIRLFEVPGRGPVRDIMTVTQPVPDAGMFIAAVNEILGRTDRAVGQAKRSELFSVVGIRPGDTEVWTTLPTEIQQAWVNQMPEMIKSLRTESEALMDTGQGWWSAPPEVGNFGENDALRANVALWGLAALPVEEAGYFRATHDVRGKALDGRNAYRLVLPPSGVPAEAFWSLTMYSEEPDGRFFLVENPIGRYALSDRTSGLEIEVDGSVIIHLRSTAPTAEERGNWLPAPEGPFVLSFRAYLPGPEIREGLWSPPPVEPS